MYFKLLICGFTLRELLAGTLRTGAIAGTSEPPLSCLDFYTAVERE